MMEAMLFRRENVLNRILTAAEEVIAEAERNKSHSKTSLWHRQRRLNHHYRTASMVELGMAETLPYWTGCYPSLDAHLTLGLNDFEHGEHFALPCATGFHVFSWGNL